MTGSIVATDSIIVIAGDLPVADLAGTPGLPPAVRALCPPPSNGDGTIGPAVVSRDPRATWIAGLLVCQPIAVVDSAHGRRDVPLPQLLSGPVLDAEVRLVEIRLSVAGSFGGCSIEAGAGRSVAAVARRLPGGRELVAVAGLVDVPVLVDDPADVRPPDAPWASSRHLVRLGRAARRRALAAIAEPPGDVAQEAWSAGTRATGGKAGPAAVLEVTEVAGVTESAGPAAGREALDVLEPSGAVADQIVAGASAITVVRSADVPVLSWVGRIGLPASGPERSRPAGRAADRDAGAESDSGGPGRTRIVLVPEGGVFPSDDHDADGHDADDHDGDEDLAETDRGPDVQDLWDGCPIQVETVVAFRSSGRPAPGSSASTPFGAGADGPSIWLDDDDRLVIRSATDSPFELRRAVAAGLALPASRVRVIAGKISALGETPERVLGAARSALSDRPDPAPSVLGTDVEVAAGSDGSDAAAATHERPDPAVPTVTFRSGVLEDAHVVVRTAEGVGLDAPGRGAGERWGTALACHLDDIAAALDRRPESVRTLDAGTAACLATLGSLPSADRDGADGHRATALAFRRPRLPGEPERRSGQISATVTSADDGSFVVAVSCGDPGNGRHHALGLVAAEVLGVPPSEVTVIGGDTDRVPPGTGGGHGFAVGATAVKRAADELRIRLKRRAARMLGVDEWYAVELVEGTARAADGRSLTLAEIADDVAASAPEPLVGRGTALDAEDVAADVVAGLIVEIDTEVGAVDVVAATVVVGAGVVVDPVAAGHHVLRTVRTRLEAIGASATADPRPGDRVVFLESADEADPFGARSLDIGGLGLEAAVRDAVRRATGVAVAGFPLDPESFLDAFEASRFPGRSGPVHHPA